MIITEFELRANWHKTKAKVITIPQGSVITPSARDFLRSKGIQIQVEGNGLLDFNKNTYSTAQQTIASAKDQGIAGGSGPGTPAQPGTPAGSLSAPAEASAVEAGPGSTQAATGEILPVGGETGMVHQPPPAASPAAGVQAAAKPEHCTHLHGRQLVAKTHPVIALRGQLDLFQCELVDTQVMLAEIGEDELVARLEEIALFAQKLMLAEVKQEPFEFKQLLGWTPEELRELSHHPDKYFGVKHSPLSYEHGVIVARLHRLRAKIREVELSAARAFTAEDGTCARTDLVQAFNRLSSAFYILACQTRSRLGAPKTVPIGVSNRHVHLSRQDLAVLFGEGYQLRVQKQLSQPGQFAAEETIALQGPKGAIAKVRILGPLRPETQVEVSVTDCYRLGIAPVVRDSGKLAGTPGLRLVGPQGSVDLKRGVIVASRHIHMPVADAEAWRLADGQRVRVMVEGQRPILLHDVLIRVSPNYALEMHLDTDEANAVLLGNEAKGTLVGV